MASCMYVCMYACMYVCVCVMCVYECNECVDVNVAVCRYVYVYVCVCVHCVRMTVNDNVCAVDVVRGEMYVCAYIHMYT